MPHCGILFCRLAAFCGVIALVACFVRVPKCNEKALELREDAADVVVTGVVRKIYGEFQGYSCAIEIVRVLKGKEVILGIPNVTEPLYHQVVTVGGFGNPRICDNQVDANDTRIFLLSYNSSSLLLNSSLVRISLSALRKTPSLDEPGQPDPCLGKRCEFGAQCVVSVDGLTTRCQCPERCDNVGASEDSHPACGSDGKDYASLCELRRESCLSLTNVHEAHRGKCDPCKGVVCRSYETCVVASAGDEPVCRCNPTVCPTRSGAALCGSNGVTYDSECELKAAACRANAPIAILHEGPCKAGVNPCLSVECLHGAECSISPKTQAATCQCPQLCPLVNAPVCGSDGNTYENECHLHASACIAKTNITVASMSACGNFNSCDDGECPYGNCVMSAPEFLSCLCLTCTDLPDPVCGSNGITYTNECHRQRDSCKRKQDFPVAHKGPCDACKDIKCDYYAVCESRNGNASCVCPTGCKQFDEPVCGSDGQMYANKCELMVDACHRQVALVPRADSSSCITKTPAVCSPSCILGAQCQGGRCECTFDSACSSEPASPQCGSDGITYNRACEMNAAICRKQKQIYIMHSGSCGNELGSGELDDTQDGSEDGGSGDDQATSDPTQKESSVSGQVARHIRCDSANCKYGGMCNFQESSTGRCQCSFTNCHGYRESLCGSDGVIYKNICELRNSSCNQQKSILMSVLTECADGAKVISERPCDGTSPLVDPTTGRDFDCSPGKGKCPSNAYCHKNEKFTKCCPIDQNYEPCLDSEFGCCADKKTPSPGPQNAGCPSMCHCNLLGSTRQTCDPSTSQCDCKRGVGGQRCDSCQPGWWGLNRISTDQPGCEPCQCNVHGSVRQDCEQNTGKCLCHSFVTGLKCDRCIQFGYELTSGGCRPAKGGADGKLTCADISCQFGVCILNKVTGQPVCSCDLGCSKPSHVVCGTNQKTYNSECQMQEYSCQVQQKVEKASDGPCKVSDVSSDLRPAEASSDPVTPSHVSASIVAAAPDRASSQTESDSSSSSDFEFEKADKVETSSQSPETSEAKPMNCDMNPCAKGICQADSVFGFVCECYIGFVGVQCNEERPFTHPYFNGKGFLELAGLPSPEKVIQVDMDFLPAAENGVMLYAGSNSNGTGDYLSVVLRAGFLEFRFDNGHGTLTLRSNDTVKINEPHRLTIRKDGRDGMLLLDNLPPVYGSAPGSLTSLNVQPRLYAGYVSPEMAPFMKSGRLLQSLGGVQSGFIGCITSFEANGATRKVYSLKYPISTTDIIRGLNIDQCQSDPCLEKPCINGGVCSTLRTGTYHCTCPRGFHGVNCAARTKKVRHVLTNAVQKVSTDVPQFRGNSYIKHSVESSMFENLYVEIWFRTNRPQGTLLWIGQYGKPTAKGDYFLVYIDKQRVHLSMDIGNGKVELRSSDVLDKDHIWHTVKIRRESQNISMSINDGDITTTVDKGPLTQMNVDSSVYIGGMPDASRPGLDGAIQKLVVNKDIFEDLLHNADILHGTELYKGSPCYPNPCPTGEVCLPMLREFRCVYP